MQDVTPEQDRVNIEYAKEILKFLPSEGRDTYSLIPGQWFYNDESKMRDLIRPSEQQSMIRTRFWDLVRERTSLRVESEISYQELSNGICSPQYVSNLLSTEFRYVGWLMTPSPDYETRVSSLLDRGYDRLKEIFELSLSDDEGRLDTKVANLILSSVKMLDQRKHGAYLQRIEEKSLQIHSSMEEANKNKILSQGMTMEQLNARILELSGGSSSSALGSSPIDVGSSDE